MGHRGLERFCGLLDLPPPVRKRSVQIMEGAADRKMQQPSKCRKTQVNSMEGAADRAAAYLSGKIAVSVDGTCQKKEAIVLR